MYTLHRDKQIQAIAALTEGCSIRATERLVGAHRDTIMHLGVRVGDGCRRLHDAMMRDLQVPVIELDEQWSFVFCKAKRARPDEPDFGDCYLFVALDALRKAVVSYVVGKRDAAHTVALVSDLRARIRNRPQITSDGWPAYPDAIDLAFARDVDFATIVKDYATTPGNDAAHRYSPGSIKGVERTVVAGDPDPDHISTSFVERFNLSTRMGSRRFTRLTNGFSKRLANHRAAIALQIAAYNLTHYHETIRCTPAMALGVADHIWSIGELMDAALAAPEPSPLVPEPRKPMSAAQAKGEPFGTPRARQLKVMKGGRR
jgi:IS1 family transposase